jgi:hypothetical protein
MALGQEVNVSNRRTGLVGSKKVVLDLSQMATIPLNRKSTLRYLAKSLDVPDVGSTLELVEAKKMGMWRKSDLQLYCSNDPDVLPPR